MTEEERGRMYRSIGERFGGVMGLSGKIKEEGTDNAMVKGLCLDYIRENYPETQTARPTRLR